MSKYRESQRLLEDFLWAHFCREDGLLPSTIAEMYGLSVDEVDHLITGEDIAPAKLKELWSIFRNNARHFLSVIGVDKMPWEEEVT
jgi:hypothetical protein